MTKPQNPYLMLPAPGGSEITLRDLLAGFALAGSLAHSSAPMDDPEREAERAYKNADAMLQERSK